MNKNFRDQIQFSPEKMILKTGKMCLLLSVICYLLSHRHKQTNKQTSKQTNKQYFILMIYNFQSKRNTILQYLQYSDHNDDNNINHKNCLHEDLVHNVGR